MAIAVSSTCVTIHSASFCSRKVPSQIHSSFSNCLQHSWVSRNVVFVKKSRPLSVAASGSKLKLVLSVSAEFSEKEAAKFKSEFQALIDQQEGLDTSGKAAAVCAEILGEYVKTYGGALSPEPFSTMKEKLVASGVSDAEKYITIAIGWARSNLYADWKKSL